MSNNIMDQFTPEEFNKLGLEFFKDENMPNVQEYTNRVAKNLTLQKELITYSRIIIEALGSRTVGSKPDILMGIGFGLGIAFADQLTKLVSKAEA